DAAGGRRDHRIADPAFDIDALASWLGESSQDLALGRPDERDGLRVRLVFLRKDRDVLPGVRQAHRLRFGFRAAVAAPLLRRRVERPRGDAKRHDYDACQSCRPRHALPASIGTKRTASSPDSMKPRPLRSISTSRCASRPELPACSGNIILPPGASWRNRASGIWRAAAATMIDWNGAAFSRPA